MLVTIMILTLQFAFIRGQNNILDKPEILKRVEECLYNTYGCNFEEARQLQQELQKAIPRHPAPYFLNALIVYWENFPLLPDDPKVESFEDAMEQTIAHAEIIGSKDDGVMESVFFEMHARAFRGMYWADNGKATKLLADIDNMYRSTMKGIEYKEVFNEFYFSSGLYNYYIDAYVEKHPIYKPIASLFREGSREVGLKELQYAIDHTTYLKYESLLFMSLLQLNYELDYEKSLEYMSQLYNLFPKNIYYLGQYLIILMHDQKFTLASAINDKLKKSKDHFSQVIYHMTRGFIEENKGEDFRVAKKHYRQVIDYYDEFGPISGLYVSIAYAGLGRIAEVEGNEREARKLRRKSRQHSSYDFILEYGQ